MITVRSERPEDIGAVRRVNEAAFDRSEEAALVDALRAAAQPYISLVAERDGQVVGHIFFSPVTLETDDGASVIVETAERAPQMLGLAPMAVLPEFQKQGIGSRLVREGLNECRRMGCEAVVVLGHPEYYPRFGFVPAGRAGLRSEYPVPDDVFMVLELKPGALPARGLVKYHPEFGNV
ncbi:MAG TPA: N-acetyltransferase [Pyrinomonadaceae bacterium]|nr:N-acetyltransferase [Pyrinomonadaceae bacterium]